MNKYEKWYKQITDNAKNRVLECYTERHHIVPVALGGADTKDNLVNLTAREHFICHWLLTKFTTGKNRYKMINALRMMRAENPNQQRYETNITSRVYENLKEEYAMLQSTTRRGKGNGFYGKTHTEEARHAISEKNKGRKQPLHEKQNQITAITGRKRKPFSEEWKQKMSEAHQGEKNHRYGVEVSEETRAKISAKMKGRKQSDEEKARRSASNLGKTKPKKLCPHCNQMIAVNTYTRWHGNNCKHKHIL